ncbi:MAG: cyclic nucleotide-binding protein [Flaviaesturariibacter sp.]|nr:cyclic nucleotide-binding protein [Flaviaesturariibacter sp.]
MYDRFFEKLAEKVTLTEAEKDLVRSFLQPKKLRRKQYLLQEGDVSKNVAFVENGMLRSYAVDEKGVDRIIQFAPEGWFVSDLYSHITGEPSGLNIDALEDSEIVLMSRDARDELLQRVPAFLKFSFEQMQSAYVALQCRLYDLNNLSTEEKYTKLLRTYPDIVQRVPQHMIASYLGLTPETLSRVRKGMAGRKESE